MLAELELTARLGLLERYQELQRLERLDGLICLILRRACVLEGQDLGLARRGLDLARDDDAAALRVLGIRPVEEIQRIRCSVQELRRDSWGGGSLR